MLEATADCAAAGCTSTPPADTPPSVTFTSPKAGSTVRGVVSMAADATDDDGVFRVVFAVDGTAVETDSNGSNGWTASWRSTAVADAPPHLQPT